MLTTHLAHVIPENVLVNNGGDDGQTSSGKTDEKIGNPFNFKPQVIHLSKDHELFEDGDIQRHLYLQNLYIPADEEPSLRVSEFACHISGCTSTFRTLQEYEHHYNSLHRHVCCTCRRSLPTARLLDIHVQEWHDSLFAVLALKQDMYQCLVEGCGLKFKTITERKVHLMVMHKYPPDFRFDKIKKDNRDKRRAQSNDLEMEVVTDVCASEVACEVMSSTTSNQGKEIKDMNISDDNTGRMETSVSSAPPRYTYRVPSNICFGQGSVRGFSGRRGKRK